MKDLLQRAKQEIVSLRRSNEVLSAQVEVVQVFAAALGFKGANRGDTVDVAWDLQREIDKLGAAQDISYAAKDAQQKAATAPYHFDTPYVNQGEKRGN